MFALLVGAWALGFLYRARTEAMEDWWYGYTPYSNGTTAARDLKSITSAQADFRFNDRDRDGVFEYWRDDLSGLYTLHSKTNPTADAIKLIELHIACADDRAVTDIGPYGTRGCRYGYWFRAVLHEDEVTPDPKRYAACAYPDSRPAGKYTYITDETNWVWRKDLKGRRGVEVFPRDPLKGGWEQLY